MKSTDRLINWQRKRVEILKKKGYRAARLDLGVPEWKEMGLPVAEREPAITQ